MGATDLVGGPTPSYTSRRNQRPPVGVLLAARLKVPLHADGLRR
jgi:hypothetical protein